MKRQSRRDALSRRALERELAEAADPVRADNLAWFFKTGKGDYGEGDRFLGISVPVQRRIALRYCDLPLTDIARLLQSRYHEHRFAALEILVWKYEHAQTERERTEIFEFYLANTAGINNWDLVDTSAPYIVGEHLKTRARDRLYRLSESQSFWERRIAVVATLALIKSGETKDTFRLAEKLLHDRHDLIQKAVGWTLREAGRVNRLALVGFLREHYAELGRTALRYAIEHFPPAQRKQLLTGNFDHLPD